MGIETIIILTIIAFILGLVLGITAIRISPLYAPLRNPSSKNDISRNIFIPQVIRKEISWQIISNTLVSPVAGNKVKNEDKVQIIYNGTPKSDARLVVVRLWNSGNVPISPQDYDNNNPIKFDFGEKAEVLDVEVLATSPSSLKDTVKEHLVLNDGSVLLDPLLLNRQDSIILKLLLAQFEGDVMVNARIAGVNQIRTYSS